MPSNAHPMFHTRLATTAQVHPRFLPYMHANRPMLKGTPMRRLPAYVAVACLGYAAVKYNTTARNLQLPDREAERATAERNNALLDAYGGRESLEELERAASLYSSQHPNQK